MRNADRARSSLALLLLTFSVGALAQAYPVRPVRVVVPFPPSAGVDVIVRLVTAPLAENLRQNIVIDNRSGAGGTLGAEIAAHSAPDGYTLLAISTSHAVNVSLYKTLNYDLMRDFAPVAPLGLTPNVLVVNAAVPAHTVKELVALARAKPRTLNFGSAGTGTASYIAGELFKLIGRVDLVHVPYKGSGPALSALLGGEVQAAFFAIPSTLPHVKAGRLRVLGVGSARRSPLLPDVPTIAEAGLPGYDAVVWYGIVAPGRTPAAIVTRLNREIVALVQSAELREKLAGQGTEPLAAAPDEFAGYLKGEIAKYARLVKEAGLTVQ
jgi:tripartite-type tricarboxylate transporter receptor subunit TctC